MFIWKLQHIRNNLGFSVSLKDTLTGEQEEPQIEQSTLRVMTDTHGHLSLSCPICLPNLCSTGTKRLTQPPKLQTGVEVKNGCQIKGKPKTKCSIVQESATLSEGWNTILSECRLTRPVCFQQYVVFCRCH